MKRRKHTVLATATGLWLAGLVVFVIPAASVPTWSSAGNLAIDRLSHQANLLADGRVLVTGGYSNASGNGGYDTKLAEIYDPGTNMWSPTGSTANGRTDHVSTRLLDGKVLVAGGENANICTNDVTSELYDPALGTWSFSGNLAVARTGPAATLLSDGKVLMAGGGNRCGGVFASAEIYDPGTGMWTSTGSMATPRQWLNAVRLNDGRVLAVGGQSGSPFPAVSSAEIYDPASGTWTATGSMATARCCAGSGTGFLTLLSNGRVLAAGGNSGFSNLTVPNGPQAEIYDPATGVWTPTGSMSTGRGGGTFSLLSDGTVLAAGGWDGTNTQSSTEIWNPATGLWSLTASLASGRIAHTGTVLGNGKVLAAAGYFENPRSYLTSAELYAANQAPTIEATGGQCIHHTSSGRGVLNLTVGDVDDSAGSLTLSASSSNTVLLPNANITFGGGGANRTMTISTVARKVGTATITVTVSDGADSTQLVVTVKVDGSASTVVTGTAGPDMLFGMAGNDSITGDGRSDVLCGGNGADTLGGGDGDDALDGAAGKDVLGAGNDDDRMFGGASVDTLTGGLGADFFSGGAGRDTNADFNAGQGDTSDGT